ncbi:hypothetical protein O3M35_001696 [Rhynocoris fuscipes]|uniref:Diphtheria toxin resistance protein 2 n=1 Tax=Rhynocoris fuscipes TaxID=488301 RepID=A0AAW1CS60_9HEMI
MADELKEFLVISELNTGATHNVPCSLHCNILKGELKHLSCRFARGYCTPKDNKFETVIYAGTDKCMTNFLMMMKNLDFYQYTGNDGFVLMNSFNLIKQSSYLIEKVKAAQTIAVLVCTLSIEQFLIAVEHVKALCKRRNKKIYVISVGKPTPTKLANFPEVDLFVSIACPEAEFYERKTFVKPVVGLLDVELALNENRTWDNTFSKDFRDLIEGGIDYIATPDEPPGDIAEVSLVENRVLGFTNSVSSNFDIDVIPDKSLINKASRKEREWDGLDPNLPASEPAQPIDGRVGTSQGYLNEKELLNNKASDKKVEIIAKKSDEKEKEDKNRKLNAS